MENETGFGREEIFKNALAGQKSPVVTLDHKWYRLLDDLGRDAAREWEEQLNTLLKQQGSINTKMKEIKKMKVQLMNEIVPIADEVNQGKSKDAERLLEEKKRLIEECNDKLDQYMDESKEIPIQINQLNHQLMLVTMEYCYDEMQKNTREIEELEEWVTKIRIELKKNLVRKQEMEQKNHEIYSYMHDIFGAEVVNLFDMKYNPEEKHPKPQN